MRLSRLSALGALLAFGDSRAVLGTVFTLEDALTEGVETTKEEHRPKNDVAEVPVSFRG